MQITVDRIATRATAGQVKPVLAAVLATGAGVTGLAHPLSSSRPSGVSQAVQLPPVELSAFVARLELPATATLVPPRPIVAGGLEAMPRLVDPPRVTGMTGAQNIAVPHAGRPDVTVSFSAAKPPPDLGLRAPPEAPAIAIPPAPEQPALAAAKPPLDLGLRAPPEAPTIAIPPAPEQPALAASKPPLDLGLVAPPEAPAIAIPPPEQPALAAAKPPPDLGLIAPPEAPAIAIPPPEQPALAAAKPPLDLGTVAPPEAPAIAIPPPEQPALAAAKPPPDLGLVAPPEAPAIAMPPAPEQPALAASKVAKGSLGYVPGPPSPPRERMMMPSAELKAMMAAEVARRERPMNVLPGQPAANETRLAAIRRSVPASPPMDRTARAQRQAFVPADAAHNVQQAEQPIHFDVPARINGKAAGRVPLLITGKDISVRLADVLGLLKPLMEPAEFAALGGSDSAGEYVTLNRLRAAGIPVRFAEGDQLILGR